MKLLSKIKKALWGVGIFFITLRTKVYALTPLYGIPNELTSATMYGVELAPTEKITDIIEGLIKFLGIIFIPLILILGIIAYAKKRENSKRVNILKIILMILVVILIVLLGVLLGLCIYRMIS